MMADNLVAKYMVSAAEARGWPRMNHGEAKLAMALTTIGFQPSDVEVQFKLGGFVIDFAFVVWRLALEADGWVHTSRQVEQRDKRRDEQLRQWGWQTIRIDTQGDIDAENLLIALTAAKATAAAAAAGYWAREREMRREVRHDHTGLATRRILGVAAQ